MCDVLSMSTTLATQNIPCVIMIIKRETSKQRFKRLRLRQQAGLSLDESEASRLAQMNRAKDAAAREDDEEVSAHTIDSAFCAGMGTLLVPEDHSAVAGSVDLFHTSSGPTTTEASEVACNPETVAASAAAHDFVDTYETKLSHSVNLKSCTTPISTGNVDFFDTTNKIRGDVDTSALDVPQHVEEDDASVNALQNVNKENTEGIKSTTGVVMDTVTPAEDDFVNVTTVVGDADANATDTPKDAKDDGTDAVGSAVHDVTECMQLSASDLQENRDRKCPDGHLMQLLTTPAPGSCDECDLPVGKGESVLACMPCNYWLCQECTSFNAQPPDTASVPAATAPQRRKGELPLAASYAIFPPGHGGGGVAVSAEHRKRKACYVLVKRNANLQQARLKVFNEGEFIIIWLPVSIMSVWIIFMIVYFLCNLTIRCTWRNVMSVFIFSLAQLPVCGMEREIMEAITKNDVVILCGPTGYRNLERSAFCMCQHAISYSYCNPRPCPRV